MSWDVARGASSLVVSSLAVASNVLRVMLLGHSGDLVSCDLLSCDLMSCDLYHVTCCLVMCGRLTV
jgi:hypothetical protein